jgi:hypothetical protein
MVPTGRLRRPRATALVALGRWAATVRREIRLLRSRMAALRVPGVAEGRVLAAERREAPRRKQPQPKQRPQKQLQPKQRPQKQLQRKQQKQPQQKQPQRKQPQPQRKQPKPEAQ